MAMSVFKVPYSCVYVSQSTEAWKQKRETEVYCCQTIFLKSQLVSSSFSLLFASSELWRLPYSVHPLHVDHQGRHRPNSHVMACISSSFSSNSAPSTSTRLYVSGLSFRTTKESLRNAFVQFGQLVEVKLVMDKIANRPRGFAFIAYATEEETKKAIDGMHGKFLDGRVIFVEVAKPRSETRKNIRIPRASKR
ncbi:hypothetical protein vseg_001819 [Gypsophila vaccaria]